MSPETRIVEPFFRRASRDKVLCNGRMKTSLGGVVRAETPDALSAWVELTEEEADMMIAQQKEAANELET